MYVCPYESAIVKLEFGPNFCVYLFLKFSHESVNRNLTNIRLMYRLDRMKQILAQVVDNGDKNNLLKFEKIHCFLTI